MAAVAAVTFSGKLACDFSLEFKRECYTNKFAVHSRTYTECTPTILVHTRLRHFRDQSAKKCAVVRGGEAKILWRVMSDECSIDATSRSSVALFHRPSGTGPSPGITSASPTGALATIAPGYLSLTQSTPMAPERTAVPLACLCVACQHARLMSAALSGSH